MNVKNDVEVIINGKRYTLCGYESSDYLQHIATHINEKYAELKKQEGYNRLDVDMRSVLLAINLSDDFFKAQKLAQELREQKEEMEKEIFEIKHELLSSQEEVDKLGQQLRESRKARLEAERKIIRLEAELGQSRTNEKLEKNLAEKTAGMPTGNNQERLAETAERNQEQKIKEVPAEMNQEKRSDGETAGRKQEAGSAGKATDRRQEERPGGKPADRKRGERQEGNPTDRKQEERQDKESMNRKQDGKTGEEPEEEKESRQYYYKSGNKRTQKKRM